MAKWIRALAATGRYLPAILPWRPLLAACALGLAPLVLAHMDSTGLLARPDRLPAVVQVAFLFTICGVAFLADGAAEPLLTALPVPDGAVLVLRLVGALPVVAATAAVQLILADSLRRAGQPGFPWPAFAAQLAGGVAVAAGAAALVSRSRWSNFGGAAAAPACIAVLAALAVLPLGLAPTDLTHRPDGGWVGVELRWLGVAVIASILTGYGLRDRWSRRPALGNG